jgi:heme-degrading monooxygenase HmoA
MYARVARYEIPPERIGEAVETFREAAKKIQDLQGFEGGYLLTDEDGGVLTLTMWASRAALETSETRASSARRGAAQAVDGEVKSVEAYEVSEQFRPVAELAG